VLALHPDLALRVRGEVAEADVTRLEEETVLAALAPTGRDPLRAYLEARRVGAPTPPLAAEQRARLEALTSVLPWPGEQLRELAGGVTAANVPWEERSAVERVWYTAGAVVANLTPVSALYAPRCLPGYLLCKLSFAGASVLAAADQLVFSGGGDLAQTRAILY